MDRADLPIPDEGIIATHFIVAADVAASAAFYSDVLGGDLVLEPGPGPAFVKLANTWIIINEGGGPTPDKPDVVVAPPSEPNRVSAFMNLRVADIQAVYEEWSARGATFLTPPWDNHGMELRCYVVDPDDRIIEVGQATGFLDMVTGGS